jgi:hopene-associated glycosyltransferase HpnB
VDEIGNSGLIFYYKGSLPLGLLSLAIWCGLAFARGGFWRLRERLPGTSASGRHVIAVIPARDEAVVVGLAVRSLLHQKYDPPVEVILVDDASCDGTADAARDAAGAAVDRLTVVRAPQLPAGWTGKLWAVSQGVALAAKREPEYLLLTDADVVHAPDNVGRLVAQAEDGAFDLTSLMVRLRCESFAERALIPAFVYFFFLLYPPAWTARRGRRTAGAAGGCMLVRPAALERIGGIEAIRGELIDDCAMAGKIKGSGGAVWLGVSSETRSVRAYAGFGDIGSMIARTAYTQLRYSPWLLVATLAGLGVTYGLAPVLAVRGDAFAVAAWALMSLTFVPILRFYGVAWIWAPTLPLIAMFYASATLWSAVLHWRGRGRQWKGRPLK